MGSRPVMTKHEVVPASPVPCSQGLSHPLQLEEVTGTVSRSNSGWQLTKWSLGMEQGGKELIKSQFAVCLL